MCTPIESAVRLEVVAAEAEVLAHAARALFVGVTGFTHEPAGRGPVKALAPATSTEHTIADFILLFRYCWLVYGRGGIKEGA